MNGDLIELSAYKNQKAIVIVNVACKWGLSTKQYKRLVKIYEKYHSKGLIILAFPCNQFMA